MPSTNRRTFIGATSAGLASLAGCDSLRSNPGVEYALYVETPDRPLAEIVRWKPGPNEDDPYAATRRDAWAAAVTGGRYTVSGHSAVPDGEYTEHDGTYYRLHDVVTGSRRVERPVLRLHWVGRAGDGDVPDATPRESLPALDRHAVLPAYFAARAREYDGGAPWDLVEEGGYVYRYADRTESELAPTPDHEYVSVHDTVLRVDVRRETLVEAEHTATATKVATSPEAFTDVADAAAVEVRLSPDELSADARALFERARGRETYTETMPLSTEFESLLSALRLREALGCTRSNCESEAYETQYLAYDGAYYDCRLYVDGSE
ncbi:hypothetical protein KTS45_06540 [Halomicroarcula limicola]|uniref:Lipoprotein n=1 Tax=Haloarcula limicola TaxID=1429915 RepID=A0A8J7Y4I9_9EURY|nr:hypothetical protein [Halomicroarcula limicola]MBV0923857.1 hypothetical protein [Halomicroarcula limicola]